MMTMTYRIGRHADKTIAAQIIAPLTCRLLSAFHRNDVPMRFSTLRDALSDVEVKREEYVVEIIRVLRRFPHSLRVESKLIQDVAKCMGCDESQAARMYVLAFLLPKQDACVAYDPTGTHLHTYMQVCAGIATQREMAKTRVELILQALLRMELEDRCYFMCRALDVPFYYARGNECVLVSLAHYHEPFVREYCRVMRPFVRSEAALCRARDLVREDFNLFASALMRLPPTASYTRRMEKEIFGDETHAEPARVIWAFCSVWFIECAHTFRSRWSLSPATMKRLWIACKEGKTLTILETTSPFGSRGIWKSE